MEHDDEELRLAPIEEDEELGLAPIEDEDAKKEIAPDLPYNTGIRLIPVICSACKTRLYAGENQVGLWKRCPDCECLTEILAVPLRFVLTADDPEAAGGYNIQDPDVSRQDIFQLKAANQKSFEEYREDQNRKRMENQLPPPVFIDQPPVMEGMLNRLLKSNEEKNEEQTIIERQLEIEKETEAIKRAVRDGKLEAYLAGSANNPDKNEQKPTEQKRPFDTATLSSIPSPPLPPTPPPLPTTLTVFPPPLPLPPEIPATQKIPEVQEFPSPSNADSARSRSSSSSNSLQHYVSNSLWLPLFDPYCRPRMIILTICGFLGNFTGEKARSMIWQILFDKVYEKYPGYSYNFMESGIFFVNFWFGAVLSVVWLTMLFILGISLFLETAAGKDRVKHWIPFDLNFGCSYLGWSLLILFVSGFPGFIIWQGTCFFLPDKESTLIILHFVGQFLCFPVLFLCVIESDTFYGNFPRQTLTSLYRHPGLWLQLYCKATVLVGIPTAILINLLFAGTAFAEHWFMQSLFYYLIAATLLTFCGYFVLLYFRLLGKTAWEIRSKQEE
ncbi:MAG: hypothetical protein LBL62_07945 [Planctomycetaceae bacterium]|jgi:hypothetical protein|nr:hypothetical protein [Planctomycetaceae bacterium]